MKNLWIKVNAIGHDFSVQKRWFKIFKWKFLSFQWSKLDNFCAYQSFLNFSKLTQLLSVGQFLIPLGAFKQKGHVI